MSTRQYHVDLLVYKYRRKLFSLKSADDFNISKVCSLNVWKKNQFVFQTIFYDISDYSFQNLFVKNEKYLQICLNYHRHMYKSTISFAYFDAFFQKIPLSKNVSLRGVGTIALMHTKIMYYLIIAIINKYFKYINDWIKIIHIRFNCMQFCLIPLC